MHIYNEHKDLPLNERKEFEKPPCEKCGDTEETPGIIITEHHVYPQRWSWDYSIQNLAVWLCQVCHGELEHIIFRHERQFGSNPSVCNKLGKWFYPNVTLDFLTKPSIKE